MIPLDQGGGVEYQAKNELVSNTNAATEPTQKIFRAEFHNSEPGSEFTLSIRNRRLVEFSQCGRILPIDPGYKVVIRFAESARGLGSRVRQSSALMTWGVRPR